MRIGDEPGLIPGLPNATYHEQTDWLSSSMLKALLPEHYKVTTTSTEALDFGALFHIAVLESHLLDGYVALDAETVGVKADGTPALNPTMTAAWKKAVAEAAADGRTVIAQSDLDLALAMRDAVMAHDTAAELLYRRGGRAELSAFTEVDGVPCKARFDRLIDGAIVDLKSTSAKPGRQSIARAVVDWGYDTSAAHYLAVAHALGLDVQALALVFVSKTAPHHVTVCDLDETFLARGRALRRRALERHLNPAVPAYEGATGFLTLNCPRWAEIAEPEPTFTYQESA